MASKIGALGQSAVSTPRMEVATAAMGVKRDVLDEVNGTGCEVSWNVLSVVDCIWLYFVNR